MDGPLFKALATYAERRVEDFNQQNLANTAQAFATLGLSDTPLFVTLARKVERRVGDFNAQDVANSV